MIKYNGKDIRQVAIEQYKKGNFKETIKLLEKFLIEAKKEKFPIVGQDYNNLFLAYYAQKEYDLALPFAKKAVELVPNNWSFLRDLAFLFHIKGRYSEGIVHLEKALELSPNTFDLLRLSIKFYSSMGNHEKSKDCASRLFDIQSSQCVIHKDFSLNVKKDIAPFSDNRQENIISFSLWGNNPFYIKGAILNAQLVYIYYPSWTCRFYCDESVPKNILERFEKLGAQIKMMPKATKAYYGLFWRFFVANDPTVKRFLIRDVDSLFCVQEKIAVDQWLSSDKLFHVVRDDYSHTALIQAGIWGGVQGTLPDMKKMIDATYHEFKVERTIDQRFLDKYIWGMIKDYTLVHDKCFSYGEHLCKYPEYGQNPDSVVIAKRWTGYFSPQAKF